MVFEWDPEKNRLNVAKHGVAFEDIPALFDAPYLQTEDRRKDYGETRYQVIGRVAEFIVYVVFTFRGKTRRIISARLANRDERAVYEEAIQNRLAALEGDERGRD